jgi:hypothetical protein
MLPDDIQFLLNHLVNDLEVVTVATRAAVWSGERQL